ncbi:cytochrome P450 family [Rhizoctonia solani]|uniref:Cytochrome P450 family n=1 Tax=Rhizoctonia solani TaxID=456999 RepID=A0A8H7H0I4_9AGAM|nr:cytochrome P450 family [Rhizoctonia solani]KAF8748966.1 cytochrome P450 family [Rhizoctonia solani]
MARENELLLVVGTVRDTRIVPRQYATGYLRTYKSLDAGKGLELFHQTEVDDVLLALLGTKGRLCAGVGKALSIDEMSKKKLLRKCENNASHYTISTFFAIPTACCADPPMVGHYPSRWTTSAFPKILPDSGKPVCDTPRSGIHGLYEAWREAKQLSLYLNYSTSTQRTLTTNLTGVVINVASSMLKLAYRYTLQGDNDTIFQDIYDTANHVQLAGMSTRLADFLVNKFPLLSYVPDWLAGTGWKSTAPQWGALKEQALSVPYEWTKTQISSGDIQPSILGALLQKAALTSYVKEDEKESIFKEIAHIIVSAGTDTTSTELVAFIVAMVLNPDVQVKAQEELDNVLGPRSLPNMSDRERLPDIGNLIQEHWEYLVGRPDVSPYPTHNSIRAMTRDENMYKDPEVFNPDSITACSFTFSKKKGPDGREIIPKIEKISNAIITELKPFDFELKLRSLDHGQLISE